MASADASSSVPAPRSMRIAPLRFSKPGTPTLRSPPSGGSCAALDSPLNFVLSAMSPAAGDSPTHARVTPDSTPRTACRATLSRRSRGRGMCTRTAARLSRSTREASSSVRCGSAPAARVRRSFRSSGGNVSPAAVRNVAPASPNSCPPRPTGHRSPHRRCVARPWSDARRRGSRSCASRVVTSCRATSAVMRTMLPASNPSHARSAPWACSICTGSSTSCDTSARSTKSTCTKASPFHLPMADGRANAPVVSLPRTSSGPASAAVGTALSANECVPRDCSTIRLRSRRSTVRGSSPRSSRYKTAASLTTMRFWASSQSSASDSSDSAWPGWMTKPATVKLPSASRTTDSSGDRRRSAEKRGSIDSSDVHDTVASTRGSASGGPPRGPVTSTSSMERCGLKPRHPASSRPMATCPFNARLAMPSISGRH